MLPLAIAASRALSESGRSRWFHGAIALLLLLGILMTGSRGGLLGALVVFGVVVWLGIAPRAHKVVVAVTAVLLVIVALVFQPGGFGQRQVENAANSSGRTDIWLVGAHSCSQYCLAGAGWGDFPTVYQQELASTPEARVQPRGATFEPHSIFLLAVIELGLPGLLLLLVGLGVALVSCLASAGRDARAADGRPAEHHGLVLLPVEHEVQVLLGRDRLRRRSPRPSPQPSRRQKPTLPQPGRLVPVEQEVP